jgi:uncharacterized membrane protein
MALLMELEKRMESRLPFFTDSRNRLKRALPVSSSTSIDESSPVIAAIAILTSLRTASFLIGLLAGFAHEVML